MNSANKLKQQGYSKLSNPTPPQTPKQFSESKSNPTSPQTPTQSSESKSNPVSWDNLNDTDKLFYILDSEEAEVERLFKTRSEQEIEKDFTDALNGLLSTRDYYKNNPPESDAFKSLVSFINNTKEIRQESAEEARQENTEEAREASTSRKHFFSIQEITEEARKASFFERPFYTELLYRLSARFLDISDEKNNARVDTLLSERITFKEQKESNEGRKNLSNLSCCLSLAFFGIAAITALMTHGGSIPFTPGFATTVGSLFGGTVLSVTACCSRRKVKKTVLLNYVEPSMPLKKKVVLRSRQKVNSALLEILTYKTSIQGGSPDSFIRSGATEMLVRKPSASKRSRENSRAEEIIPFISPLAEGEESKDSKSRTPSVSTSSSSSSTSSSSASYFQPPTSPGDSNATRGPISYAV